MADPNRRQDILRAARAVFRERGYGKARMSDIAERAGVATGTVYLYFGSKEDLVSALCENYLSRLNEKLAVTTAISDTAEAIEESVRATLAFAESERDILRLLDLRTALGKRGELLPADQELHRALALSLQQRMDNGQIHHYDPVLLAELIGGLMEWVSKACLVWGDSDITRYEDVLIRMLQQALLADSGERPQRG